jgi:hypothetical protein
MFTLNWEGMALDQLADVYVAATAEERERIAVEALNARLRADPLAVGESRVGGFRITFVPRLTILLHVSEASRTVRVIRLRPSRR